MGNCSGKNTVKQKNKPFYETNYHNCYICLAWGDVTNQETDIIVNLHEDPYNPQYNQILKKSGQKLCQQLLERSSLQPGQCNYSNSGALKCKLIIHSNLPKYQGGDEGALKDLRAYAKTYYEIFKQCEQLDGKSITFGDISYCVYNQRSQNCPPSIFLYSALMMGMTQFFYDFPQNKLQLIKFMSNDEATLRNMQFEVEKKVDCIKIDKIYKMFQDRDKQFFQQNSENNENDDLKLNQIQFNMQDYQNLSKNIQQRNILQEQGKFVVQKQNNRQMDILNLKQGVENLNFGKIMNNNNNKQNNNNNANINNAQIDQNKKVDQ